MKVSEALATRRSIRAFRDEPVEPTVVRRVLQRAARAPSGGNLQPWLIHAIAGEPLARLKTIVAERIADHPRGEEMDYAIYPPQLDSPYTERRYAVGEALYASIGVAREDRAGRRAWFNRNFAFFDAPLALFCFVERTMGPPQWSDLGMYLQSVMLLLREEGLDSCAQECWALYPRTIAGFCGVPDSRMLFCGMAVGYRDAEAPINNFPVERAPLEAFATFMGFDA